MNSLTQKLQPRRGFPTKRRVARIRATLEKDVKNAQPRRGCLFHGFMRAKWATLPGLWFFFSISSRVARIRATLRFVGKPLRGCFRSAPPGRCGREGRFPPVPRGYALHRRLFTLRASGAVQRNRHISSSQYRKPTMKNIITTPKACNVNNRRWSEAEPADSAPATHRPGGARQTTGNPQ